MPDGATMGLAIFLLFPIGVLTVVVVLLVRMTVLLREKIGRRLEERRRKIEERPGFPVGLQPNTSSENHR
jgi:hypothetical protein